MLKREKRTIMREKSVQQRRKTRRKEKNRKECRVKENEDNLFLFVI